MDIFIGYLLLLFIGLKLAGIIAWSWWWVLSPLWVPLMFLLAVSFLVSIFERYTHEQ